jgi:hypothetical protein
VPVGAPTAVDDAGHLGEAPSPTATGRYWLPEIVRWRDRLWWYSWAAATLTGVAAVALLTLASPASEQASADWGACIVPVTRAARDGSVIGFRGPDGAFSLVHAIGLSDRDRDNGVYRLMVYDPCIEDGDELEVRIDGQPPQVIPLTHRGTAVTILLPASGRMRIDIRALRDGDGIGVTAAVRGARGDYFLPNLAAGGVIRVEVVGPGVE